MKPWNRIKLAIGLCVGFSAITVLAGCSTAPVSPDAAARVAPLQYAEPTAARNSALTIIRGADTRLARCELDFYILGQHVATLADEKTKVTMWLPAGDYSVTAINPGHGTCLHVSSSVMVTLSPSHNTILQTGFTSQTEAILLYQWARN